jgi:hypothetical protein
VVPVTAVSGATVAVKVSGVPAVMVLGVAEMEVTVALLATVMVTDGDVELL